MILASWRHSDSESSISFHAVIFSTWIAFCRFSVPNNPFFNSSHFLRVFNLNFSILFKRNTSLLHQSLLDWVDHSHPFLSGLMPLQKRLFLLHTNHPSLLPIFLSSPIDLEGSSSLLNFLLEIIVEEPSFHGNASSTSGITDHDKELWVSFLQSSLAVHIGLGPILLLLT